MTTRDLWLYSWVEFAMGILSSYAGLSFVFTFHLFSFYFRFKALIRRLKDENLIDLCSDGLREKLLSEGIERHEGEQCCIETGCEEDATCIYMVAILS
jgi:hypothetical protein